MKQLDGDAGRQRLPTVPDPDLLHRQVDFARIRAAADFVFDFGQSRSGLTDRDQERHRRAGRAADGACLAYHQVQTCLQVMEGDRSARGLPVSGGRQLVPGHISRQRDCRVPPAPVRELHPVAGEGVRQDIGVAAFLRYPVDLKPHVVLAVPQGQHTSGSKRCLRQKERPPEQTGDCPEPSFSFSHSESFFPELGTTHIFPLPAGDPRRTFPHTSPPESQKGCAKQRCSGQRYPPFPGFSNVRRRLRGGFHAASAHQEPLGIDAVGGAGIQGHIVAPLLNGKRSQIGRVCHQNLVHLIGQHPVQNRQGKGVSQLQLVQIREHFRLDQPVVSGQHTV